ncbi:hypothetical protein ACIP79_12640 [Streptomyces sp. NPDC088747]|uniref:nSTAND1 domain-containing NTPase n=1 Tax=Streptomyces sp. NPDC088747 TaxID=3365886 RepID=UPI0037FFA4B9
MYEELSKDPANLGRVVRQAAARSENRDDELVLIVDQFEEIFTLCQDDAERDCFIRALVAATSDESVPCRVVLEVRADSYAHCTHHPLLVEAMRGDA